MAPIWQEIGHDQRIYYAHLCARQAETLALMVIALLVDFSNEVGILYRFVVSIL